MLRFRGLIGLVLMACPGGCVHGDDTLFGSYVAHDMGLDEFRPAVTLVLDKSRRYRFCEGTRCSAGSWSMEQPIARDGHGRITFHGVELEKWLRDFNTAAFHSNDPGWLDEVDGRIDLDVDIDQGVASITLGAGDAAFVKQ